MAGNRVQITDAGRAALVAAGNTGTTAHQVTQIGFGTAPFVFKPNMTALPSELKRITTFGGDTVAPDTIHLVVQDDTADQYKLYAFGLYLENGVLFGVFVQNDPILEKAPASTLLLAADTVFTSVDVAKLEFGPATFLNPPATTERQGVIELATQAEVDAGADTVRALTPKTAAARYAPLVAPRFTGPVSIAAAPDHESLQVDGNVRASNYAISDQGPGASGFVGINRGNNGPHIAMYGRTTAGAGSLVMNTGGQDRARVTEAGRVVIGAADDDGANLLQVAGSIALTSPHPIINFSNGGPTVWSPASKTLAITNGNGEVLRVTPGGRLLVGTTADDGASALQVAGAARVAGEVQTTNPNGLRVVQGSYGAFLRNDGSNVFLLQTGIGDQYGAGNAFRPFQWGLADGYVTIDGTGAGAAFGGAVKVAKGLTAGGSVFGSGTRGALIASNGGGTQQTSIVLKRDGADQHQKDWEVLSGGDGALSIRSVDDDYRGSRFALAVTRPSGIDLGVMQLMPEQGRVLIGTTADDGAHLLQVAGEARARAFAVDGGASNWSTIYFNTAAQTRFSIGKNSADNFQLNAWADDGNQAGALEVDRASQVVSFEKRPKWAGGSTPWDSGNFNPDTKANTSGADFTGDVFFKSLVWFTQGVTGAGSGIYNDAGKYNLVFRSGAPGAFKFSVIDEDGRLRLHTRPAFGSNTPWDSGNFNPDGKINKGGDTMTGRLTLAKDGWDGDVGLRAVDNWWTYLRARRSGGIEFINSAYNSITFSVDDWGTVFLRGQQTLNTDGNLYCAYRGAWMSNILDDLYNRDNTKAGAGARVQWDSGVNNFGTIAGLNGALPAPWVVCGLSGPGNGTANAITVYGVLLRNQ